MELKYIRVGLIINTHGIRGELKVNPLTDDMKRFNKLDAIYIGEDKILHNITNVKYVKGFPIIKLKDIDNINDVLKYKNEYIYIDRADLVKLPKGKYFIFDLIDCEVYDMDNNYIGILTEVNSNTSNDIYVVKDKNNKEHLIPAVKQFIKSIDSDEKKIVIDPIEGMIE